MVFDERSFPQETPKDEKINKRPITRRAFLKGVVAGAIAGAAGATAVSEVLKKQTLGKKEGNKRVKVGGVRAEEMEMLEDFRFEVTPEEKKKLIEVGIMQDILPEIRRMPGYERVNLDNFNFEIMRVNNLLSIDCNPMIPVGHFIHSIGDFNPLQQRTIVEIIGARRF